MSEDKRELERMKNMYKDFSQKVDQVKRKGEENLTTSRFVCSDSEDLSLTSKTYNYQGTVFSINMFRDNARHFSYRYLLFEKDYEGKKTFCKVVFDNVNKDGAIVSRYNITMLSKKGIMHKEISSDTFDGLEEDDRRLIMFIHECRSNARYCDYLEKVGVIK
ncbi:MAG: hypothetical protein IJX25_04320 [Clostridia bacterium]|nr:hypothetical protein [Clostridia bacterium]